MKKLITMLTLILFSVIAISQTTWVISLQDTSSQINYSIPTYYTPEDSKIDFIFYGDNKLEYVYSQTIYNSLDEYGTGLYIQFDMYEETNQLNFYVEYPSFTYIYSIETY